MDRMSEIKRHIEKALCRTIGLRDRRVKMMRGDDIAAAICALGDEMSTLIALIDDEQYRQVTIRDMARLITEGAAHRRKQVEDERKKGAH